VLPSSGSGVLAGGCAPCIVFSASAISARTSSIRTARGETSRISVDSSVSVDMPTTSPAMLKSGVPALSSSRRMSDTIERLSSRLTVPVLTVARSSSGTSIAYTFSRSRTGLVPF
jgi:hypothetical protein